MTSATLMVSRPAVLGLEVFIIFADVAADDDVDAEGIIRIF